MKERCFRAADALWPTFLMWIILILVALWQDAHWPNSHYFWRLLIISALATEYFLLKASTVVVRWYGWSSVAAVLVFTNSLLAFAFFLQTISLLWPEWAGRHVDQLNYVGYLLMVGFVVGILEWATLPPPIRTNEREPPNERPE
jgi:hypothetical protein